MDCDTGQHVCSGTLDDMVARANALLATGPCHPFVKCPHQCVPRCSVGVYTVWDKDERFMYVGMAGRTQTIESVQQGQVGGKHCGLFDRLKSHASGRRSGDRFCVYVADRVVLPELGPDLIKEIAKGIRSFDAEVKKHIDANYSYRFAITDNATIARELEARLRAGEWESGKPFFNPDG